MSHVAICHRCPRRQQQCQGPCACTIDGRDIIEHAAAGDCPEGRFSGAAEPPPAPPSPDIPLAGDLVESLAKRLGADRLAKWWERRTGAPCGCQERKARLNRATALLLRRLK